jgi:hypothetical protein
LSSHRAGRTISVSDWFKKLNLASTEADPLPNSNALLPALPSAPRAPALVTSAVLTLLAVTVAAWILTLRLTPGGRAGGETVLSAEANVSRVEGPFVSSNTDSSSSLAPVTQAASIGKVRTDGSHTRYLSASGYDARPGERFAEIRVHRSPGRRGDVPFIWWTEAASAKPGVDYVQQPEVTQSFPKGKNSTSFFVKLLREASRHRPEVFYVAIGDAKGGKSLGQIVHTAVWLPSNLPADAMSTPQIANVVQSTPGTN